ncbi:MAG: DUF4249 domain-containing protein [Muribaculaceae bacterium]|nr:DUF4249 domain-containing protein [Muribaculaceae bacterium]
MAILRRIYTLLLLLTVAAGLTSCYTTFEPDLPSTPVLCMNSQIRPGEEIPLMLTRTWLWTEGDEKNLNIFVTDAEVRLIVNGEFRENLSPSVTGNGYDPDHFLYEEYKCFKSTYVPKSGDRIRLEATSREYGEAWAETKVPYPVPVDRVVPDVKECVAVGNTSQLPVTTEPITFDMNFDLMLYFTDPDVRGNYYDLVVSYSQYQNDEDCYSYLSTLWVDFTKEPLFTEHISALESALTDNNGYSIFSDRQINGKTYPLRINFPITTFYYSNPLNQQWPKDYGIVLTLRHIDEDYYKHVISVWQANTGIVGALGGVGLASPAFAYSNVSTGAGIVAAYAESEITIPLIDIVEAAKQK